MKNHIEKYVVAGNHSQFVNYVNKNSKDGVFYTYVYGPDQLRGLSEISGVFIGTFEDREDIEEIRLQIKLIKSRGTINNLTSTYWAPVAPSRHDKNKDYEEALKMLMTSSMTQEQYKKISATAFSGESNHGH